MSTRAAAARSFVEHPVGPLAGIPVGEGRSYDVAGRQIAVFRLRNGQVHATQAVCPHRGGPLADGQLDERIVICPLHAYAFVLATGRRVGDQDGDAASGSVGAHSTQPEISGSAAAVQVYPVRVDEGTVVVTLDDATPSGHPAPQERQEPTGEHRLRRVTDEERDQPGGQDGHRVVRQAECREVHGEPR